MSELTECSIEDDLDQIDKHVQLVSTSSDSSHIKDDNPNKMDVEEEKTAIDTFRQSNNSYDSLDKTDLKPKLHNSCNDLFLVPVDTKFDIKYPKTNQVESLQTKKNSFKRSASCMSLISGEKANPRRKYDHVQSKVKQYFKNHSIKTETPPVKPKISPKKIIEDKPVNKEEYLEEINKRLTRELDEKNAILTKLQENYEQLLFKYAEAQNRIDQLRFKAINGSAENTSRSGFKPKSSRTSIRIPLNSFYNSDFPESKEDDPKCQKAIVAPFMKNDSENKSEVINRPSSLPIETNLKVVERDALKAATPTDSEGVSSVITSMSGHSKILNTLDEENDKKSKLQYQNAEFILEGNSVANDPFDKVKNWQNSLPPLEQIETPDTTLYDVPQDPDISPSTNYNEISPCNVNKNPLIDDTFPCWHEKGGPELHRSRSERNKAMSQAVMKKYLRTLSLPGSLTRRNLMSIIYRRKNHHTIDATASPMRSDFNEEELKNYQNNENKLASPKIMPKDDVPSSCIIQRRKKKPPLLRCSSLPAYDYDSPKSGNARNPGLYIPPLDLDNLTLSDDESSPQLDCYLSKSNVNTSPSFLTSRSMDCSFQTLQSGKATISEFSDSQFVRPSRPLFKPSKLDFLNSENKICSPGCDMYRDGKLNKSDSKNWCNVCGETITGQNFPYRSNSFQSVQEIKDPIAKSSVRRTRHPFNRSVSFNSENNSPSYCFHNEEEKMFSPYRERSNDSLEKFDIYASNLKARSQVIMKALTAHVNNS